MQDFDVKKVLANTIFCDFVLGETKLIHFPAYVHYPGFYPVPSLGSGSLFIVRLPPCFPVSLF